jgi:hypothetical protein
MEAYLYHKMVFCACSTYGMEMGGSFLCTVVSTQQYPRVIHRNVDFVVLKSCSFEILFVL